MNQDTSILHECQVCHKHVKEDGLAAVEIETICRACAKKRGQAKKKLTRAEKRAYIEKPWTCPFCGHEEQSSADTEYECEIIIEHFVCGVCERSWNQIFRLVDITY